MARRCRSLRRCNLTRRSAFSRASRRVGQRQGERWGHPMVRDGARAPPHHEDEKQSKESRTMPIKYEELMALKNLGQKHAYSDREVMLYAIGIGIGADPM